MSLWLDIYRGYQEISGIIGVGSHGVPMREPENWDHEAALAQVDATLGPEIKGDASFAIQFPAWLDKIICNL